MVVKSIFSFVYFFTYLASVLNFFFDIFLGLFVFILEALYLLFKRAHTILKITIHLQHRSFVIQPNFHRTVQQIFKRRLQFHLQIYQKISFFAFMLLFEFLPLQISLEAENRVFLLGDRPQFTVKEPQDKLMDYIDFPFVINDASFQKQQQNKHDDQWSQRGQIIQKVFFNQLVNDINHFFVSSILLFYNQFFLPSKIVMVCSLLQHVVDTFFHLSLLASQIQQKQGFCSILRSAFFQLYPFFHAFYRAFSHNSQEQAIFVGRILFVHKTQSSLALYFFKTYDDAFWIILINSPLHIDLILLTNLINLFQTFLLLAQVFDLSAKLPSIDFCLLSVGYSMMNLFFELLSFCGKLSSFLQIHCCFMNQSTHSLDQMFTKKYKIVIAKLSLFDLTSSQSPWED